MTNANVLVDYDRVLDAVRRLVAGVGTDQWRSSTPCSEWDVRALVNHVHTGNLLFAAIVRGEPGPDRTRDLLGADPVSSFGEGGQALRAAFAAPGALTRTYDSPIGPASGEFLVHLRINEMLVHGWDLARATGQSADLPADLAARGLAMWRQRLASMPRGGPFAPEQPVAPDAPAIDRLAALLGREV